MGDENEVKALADRLMRAKASWGEWNSVAREALRWRDETRPVQAPPAAVPDVDWRELYRIQTAMRYMDNNPGLTRDHAFSWADQEVADAERAQGECPHAARCDCLGGCKRGMRGNGAVEVKP